MRYKKLTLEQALSLEDRGDIEIYYPGGITKMDPFHDRARIWADNFEISVAVGHIVGGWREWLLFSDTCNTRRVRHQTQSACYRR